MPATLIHRPLGPATWLLVGFFCATTAAAQTPANSPQETRRAGLLQQATRARAQQNWVEVVRLLREAIELRPTDSVRLGLAGALQELGRHQEAAVYASQCIRTLSSEARPSAEQQTLLRACRRLLDDSSAHIATVTVRATLQGWQRAALEVDGERIEGFTVGEPVYLTPGPRRLRLLGSAVSGSWTAEAERTEFLTAGSSPSVEMAFPDSRLPASSQEAVTPLSVSPPDTIPQPTTPIAPSPRFHISLGGGIGLAYLEGRLDYVQERVLIDSMGRVVATTCGDFACYENFDPGFVPTNYLIPSIALVVSPRLAIAASARIQFDAADWSVAPATSTGQARSNPFANLLLSCRLMVTINETGWSSQGSIWYAIAGAGIGQIEPRPEVPRSETRPGGHVLSGYGNAHAGLGWRSHFGRTGFYADASVVAQFMFPNFLFNADLTAAVGYRI